MGFYESSNMLFMIVNISEFSHHILNEYVDHNYTYPELLGLFILPLIFNSILYMFKLSK